MKNKKEKCNKRMNSFVETIENKEKHMNSDIIKKYVRSFIKLLFTIVLTACISTRCTENENRKYSRATLDEKIKDIESLENDVKKIKESCIRLDERFESEFGKSVRSAAVLEPNEMFLSSLSLSTESEDTHVFNGKIKNTIKPENIVAKSLDGTKEYSFSEIRGKRVLLMYKEKDGSEVYFCGKYNRQFHWDGDCLINVYKEERLIAVTEAYFKDGKRRMYKQFLPNEQKSEWFYNARECKGGYNEGVTKTFSGDVEIKKSFETSKVTGADLYTVNDFMKNRLDKNVKLYYDGNTSEGRFNDNSGKACYVSYDEHGDVLTLYVGRIKDSEFDDDSGNAWYITRKAKKPEEQKTMKYMYYKGKFVKGEAVSNAGQFKMNLSLEDIKEYTKKLTIESGLRWHK